MAEEKQKTSHVVVAWTFIVLGSWKAIEIIAYIVGAEWIR